MSAPIALDHAWAHAHPLPRPASGGKEERGRVLIVGGGVELLGAARLAGEAALRAGAGKLQLTAPQEAMAAVSLTIPEALVLPFPSGPKFKPDEALLRSLEHADAVAIGPGMTARHADLANALASHARSPLVLDAAALSAAKAVEDARDRLVLTPHAGEMAQLLGTSKGAIEADPLGAAMVAAERFKAVVTMKGAATFIVAPDRSPLRYAGGGPGLGVSGSGDVLAGLIAGLLARGVPAFEAAAWGVFLHGQAGRVLAGSIGALGFLARDIAPEVPAIIEQFAASQA